jgi:hypothetical protein
MNRQWHQENPMPPKADFEQKVAWHQAHMEACGCRKPPAAVAKAIEEKNLPGAS